MNGHGMKKYIGQISGLIGSFLLGMSSCWLFYALITYNPEDISLLFDTSQPRPIANGAGWLGAYVVSFLLYIGGFSTVFLLPVLIIIALWCARMVPGRFTLYYCLSLLLLFLVSAVTSSRWGAVIIIGEYPGGLVGFIIMNMLKRIDKHIADFIISGAWGIVALLIISISRVGHLMRYAYNFMSLTGIGSWYGWLTKRWQAISVQVTHTYKKMRSLRQVSKKKMPPCEERTISVEPRHTKRSFSVAYRVPPSHLFIQPSHEEHQTDAGDHQDRARILTEKLERFGIKGSVTSITNGPVVTLFEYQPAIDTKISTIIAREDDLALALQAHSLRIIAPIPGRSVVGFEVANTVRQAISFSELVQTKAYTTTRAALPLLLGQDTKGKPIIIDLGVLPHLLIAGTTGSGKSVALHTMLMSLLCKYSPDEVRLIIGDPKRLEFAAYADCAHLMVPIITDVTTAVAALRFAVRTMQERYEKMAQAGVRNIQEYRLRSKEPFPFIVIIIDELADLMMSTGKEIESLLIRLAQMSRAAGIHMIVATQRPSVDVITGLIKANFPARLALKVASRIDSRTILDTIGAERLLGKGDMLFLESNGTLSRIHGAYVSEQEVMQVTNHIRSQSLPCYADLGASTLQEMPFLSQEDDVLYSQVCAFLNEVEEISISLLQRRFRIGYNRSARIIELLQSQGLISAIETGVKTRRVIRTSANSKC
jgi:DNA segregation ATPase FtsK/SpoIIIE, S-DNA-T family